MRIELSSTRQHDIEQASAAFRNTAEILAELRGQLINHGFSEEAAESMCETAFALGLDS